MKTLRQFLDETNTPEQLLAKRKAHHNAAADLVTKGGRRAARRFDQHLKARTVADLMLKKKVPGYRPHSPPDRIE
jgi:hypothetical protein